MTSWIFEDEWNGDPKLFYQPYHMNGWEKLQPITFFWNRILSRQEILARIVGEKERVLLG